MRRPCARSASSTSTTACGPTNRSPHGASRGACRSSTRSFWTWPWILRKAFEELLPEEIVWRQKEQFSDGVGYGWIDTLKRITSEAVSDREMEHAAERFPINPPRNKEEYYYRTIFEEHFPSQTAAQCVPSVPSVACSTAEALAWDAAFRDRNDPSGRAVLGVHNTDLTHG